MSTEDQKATIGRDYKDAHKYHLDDWIDSDLEVYYKLIEGEYGEVHYSDTGCEVEISKYESDTAETKLFSFQPITEG